MKRIILIAFVCMSLQTFSQSADWIWAMGTGSIDADQSYDIAVDNNGNSYVTGSFKDTVMFGSFTLISNNSSTDIFVVKFDASGNVTWANHAGGTSDDDGSGIAIDSSGNCYVTGTFDGNYSIDFDSITLNGNGDQDAFIVKYNASGIADWAKVIGGLGFDYGDGIAADNNGNIFVTGNFDSPEIILDSDTLTCPDISGDLFVVKLDTSGNVIWSKSARGNDDDYGNAIAVDDIGNSYVTGNFHSSTISFDSIMLSNSGAYDFFIVKYDTSGNAVWAESAIGANDYEQGEDIAVDADGYVYVTGEYYSSTVTFGSLSLHNNGDEDGFVVKYDSSGNALWANNIGGNSNDECTGIALDASANCYVTGLFNVSIIFGSDTLMSSGADDIFVSKYDSSGNIVWAKRAGGNDYDDVRCIAVTDNGSCYISGGYESDSIVFGSSSIHNNGWWDFFIAVLSEPTLTAEDFHFNAMHIFPNPASDILNIQLPHDLENSKVEIYNMIGENYFTSEGRNCKYINIQNWSSGYYFIKVSSAEHSYTERFIIVDN